MTLLIAGMILFFGTHLYSAFRSRAPGKDLKARLGYGPFMGLYSLLALAGITLLVMGYNRMPDGPLLHAGFAGARAASHVLVGIAFVLLAAAYVPGNYFKAWVKHPMVLGVGLWALAHLLTGADLRNALLFGSFLAYSLVDFAAAMARPAGPPAALSTVRTGLALLVGAAAYGAVFLWGHEAVIGVSPA